jgi:hypothetical protein
MLTAPEKQPLPLPDEPLKPPLEGELLPPLEEDGDSLPPMYRETEVALWLGVSVGVLGKARRDGSGPPFVTIGKSVAYPADGLKTWVQTARRTVDKRPRRQRGAEAAA